MAQKKAKAKASLAAPAIGTTDKGQKIDQVQATLVEMIAEQGLERISIADLSKRAKVSRAWIYKFLGSDREALVRQSALFLGRSFSDLDKEEVLPKSVQEVFPYLDMGSQKMVHQMLLYPWFAALYFRYVGSATPLGEVIDQVEKEYFAKLSGILKKNCGMATDSALLKSRALLKLRMGLLLDWTRRPQMAEQRAQEGILKELYAVTRIVVNTSSN